MSTAYAQGFVHEAFFYGSRDEYLAGTVPFIREGIAEGEPVLVAAPADRLALLREALSGDADRIGLVDMTAIGRNPTAIIAAWRDFVVEHDVANRPARGIGEPIYAGRSPEEIMECQRHESLLNLAFGAGPAWQLVCPYDTSMLPEAVIAEARRSHPILRDRGGRFGSDVYAEPASMMAAAADDLAPIPDLARRMTFGRGEIGAVRRLVGRHARQAGLGEERIADLVLAASEIATNSVLHGGGCGTVAIWRQGDAIVCDVRDRGRLRDPLAGRSRPPLGARGGHGMWLVNALCDLVQVRALPEGSVVRLTMRIH